MSPLLSVVVPTFNEGRTVRLLLDRVLRVPIDMEVIVVDDGSSDDTPRVLAEVRRPNVRVLTHDRNRGKGAALRTGFAAAQGSVVLVQDADLEYDPSEYPVLLQPILDGRADAVFGSRFLGGTHRVLYFWHRVGNGVLTLLSNMVTNLNLSDMECCYKAVRRDVLGTLALREDRFGFEPEITCRLARARARIYEVSVSYSGRTYEEGKKITWKDGYRAIWCLLKYGLFRR